MRKLLPISICLVLSACCSESTFPMEGVLSSEKKTQKSLEDCSSSTFVINYSNADLNTILITSYKMTLTWHTLKKGLGIPQQSLNSYDKHNVNVELSQEDRLHYEKWVDKNHLFSFRDYYPPSDSGSYGAAFESSLYIKFDSKEKTISWDDTSNCLELREAIKKLCKLTDKFK